MSPPTRPQRYCDPASLVRSFLACKPKLNVISNYLNNKSIFKAHSQVPTNLFFQTAAVPLTYPLWQSYHDMLPYISSDNFMNSRQTQKKTRDTSYVTSGPFYQRVYKE